MRVAIVEAEPAAADILTFVAQRRGHQPICLSAVERMFERLPFEPAVVILSVHADAGAALAGIARLRAAHPDLVQLVVTEKAAGLHPVEALKAGANDVVRSPYNPFELIIKAESWCATRAPAGATGQGIRLADLEIDLDVFAATKNGHRLTLTKLERRLLFCLCQHYPNVATIERLLVFGWESLDDPDAALLKTHVSHIRKKLREAGGVPFEIVSQQTIGYSLRVEEARGLAS